MVTRQSHNSVYDKATRGHFQEYGSDSLVLLARHVGQVGIVSPTTIPLFTYLNGEQNKVSGRPGGDIKVDVRVLVQRWEGGEGGRGICTDGCPVSGHIRGAGGGGASRQQPLLPSL